MGLSKGAFKRGPLKGAFKKGALIRQIKKALKRGHEKPLKRFFKEAFKRAPYKAR